MQRAHAYNEKPVRRATDRNRRQGKREKNVNNKIARGGVTAAFFLQCMEAIGVHNIQLKSD